MSSKLLSTVFYNNLQEQGTAYEKFFINLSMFCVDEWNFDHSQEHWSDLKN